MPISEQRRGRKEGLTTHIECVFLRGEYPVIVRNPYAQALLQGTDDLAELFDGTRVHDPRGGTYEPQGRDLVPRLGGIC